MARYDRIAPIVAPARAATFPGWLVLRDLQGRERDAELARRARLRFLALRPLRRVLALGLEGVSAASHKRQIEGVREELGHLPARDPERVRLARYLHVIERRDPPEMAEAAAGLGSLAEETGHGSAAEEFYVTSLELASLFALPRAAAAARLRLGELCVRLGRADEAAAHLAAAAAAALDGGPEARPEWAKARAAAALLDAQRGDPAGARAAMQEVARQGSRWGDPAVQTLAAIALADLALTGADPDAALEQAWTAVECAGEAPARAAALERTGRALRALGLHEAAARCYDHLLREPLAPADRWRVRADQAAALAESGQVDSFMAARRRLLRDARTEPPPPRAAAEMHLRLARACLAAHAPDYARDHVRDGLDLAGRGGWADVVAEFERVLPSLEQDAARKLAPRPLEPGERARQIAGAIEALEPAAAPI